jgi:hypothetical protein
MEVKLLKEQVVAFMKKKKDKKGGAAGTAGSVGATSPSSTPSSPSPTASGSSMMSGWFGGGTEEQAERAKQQAAAEEVLVEQVGYSILLFPAVANNNPLMYTVCPLVQRAVGEAQAGRGELHPAHEGPREQVTNHERHRLFVALVCS